MSSDPRPAPERAAGRLWDRLARLVRRASPQPFWERLLETPAVWLLLWLAVGLACCLPGRLFFVPTLKPGEIAERDFVATRDLLLADPEATAVQRDEARKKVLPVYDLDRSIEGERDAQWAAFFAEGRRRLAEAGGEAGAKKLPTQELVPPVFSSRDLRVSAEQASLLLEKGFSPDLEERLRGATARALTRGVVGNKETLLENRINGVTLRNLATGGEQVHFDLFDHLGHPDEVRDFLAAEARSWRGYTPAERRLLVELMVANIPLNLHLNQRATLLRSERAAAEAGEVYVQLKTGQMIARRGDQIDARQARLIAEMQGGRRAERRWPTVAALLGLLALTAGLVHLGLAREKVADHSRRRVFGEGLLLLTLALVFSRLGLVVATALGSAFENPALSSWQSYAYALPWAWLAVVSYLLLGRNAAILLSVAASLFLGRMSGGGDAASLILYSFAGSLAAILALDRYQFRQRLVVPRVGLWVALANAAVVLILGSLAEPAGKSLAEIGFGVACALLGGMLVAAVASVVLPVLEALFGITTDIRLVELSNTNLPLLRRLAFEAPGTFQHSLMVANLAKEGAEAVGADPILAYTASLYHDVGKVFRPDYFIENQRPGHNRHDKLQPSMSALILVNHVKEGVELARQYGLPRVLHDAIEQHHGTRLIRYFYNRAVEQSGAAGPEVREEKYRYPGPRPQNKVMGILMLADGVEAASRTLGAEAHPAQLRELIRQIFEDCRTDGQLDQTDLTLADLRQVAEAFLRLLSNVFHQRVDYPGFDFGARRDKRTATGTTGNVIRMRRE